MTKRLNPFSEICDLIEGCGWPCLAFLGGPASALGFLEFERTTSTYQESRGTKFMALIKFSNSY